MTNEKLQNIVEYLSEMKVDSTVPRNIKSKMNDVVQILKGDEELSFRKDKAVHIFDVLNDDVNIDSFTRTQLWNIVSLIESLD